MKRQPLAIEPVFNEPSFARRYAKKHLGMARRFGRELSEKLKRRGFKTGRILDAGCGFGETINYIANKFPRANFMGVDLSEPLLEIANSNAAKMNVSGRVEFKKGDVHNLPYPDDHFDAVINVNMLHLVEDPVKMLNELERVLSRNGGMFIADIRRSWVGWFEKEFRSALTVNEAAHLINQSNMRDGVIAPGVLWWRFEVW